MKVILLQKVPNLGELGDAVSVRSGYARNFLFPQGKAERATPSALADFESRRGELEKQQQERQQAAEQARNSLDGYLLQIPARASADGGLYGSITTAVIASALNAEKIAGVDIRRGQVILPPEGNLKTVGDHSVGIMLQPGMQADITVAVLAEGDSEGGKKSSSGPTAADATMESSSDGEAELESETESETESESESAESAAHAGGQS